MFERFTDRSRRVVILAQEEARILNHNYIGTEHILLGLIQEGAGVAAITLRKLGISLDTVRQQVEEIIGQGQQTSTGHIPFTPRAKKVLEFSRREALSLKHNYIGTEHILLGLVREGESVAAQVLVQLGADLNRVRQQVIQLLDDYEGKVPAASGGSSESAPSTSTSLVLDQIGRNLTTEARQGKLDPIIGRQTEMAQITQVLMLRTRNSAMLVGEPGVGKTAIVEGLAQRIADHQVPLHLKDTELYSLDPTTLVARSRQWTDFEERLNAFRNEISRHKKVVLFIDDIHPLISAGQADGVVDAASILKPMLVRGEVQVIATTTPGDFHRHLGQDTAFPNRFQPIHVAAPTISHTLEVIKGLRGRYEAHHRLSISDDVLVMITDLADRSLPGRSMPGSAIDLLDLAGAQARMRATAIPQELRTLEQQLARARVEFESAIDGQDFEKAAALRDTAKQLMGKKKSIEDGTINVVIEVEAADVTEALSFLAP